MKLLRKFFHRFYHYGFSSALQSSFDYMKRRWNSISFEGNQTVTNLFTHEWQPPTELCDLVDIIPNPLKGNSSGDDVIVWIIPDFDIGSGGHSTIFRFSQILSFHGFKQHFLVHGLHFHHDEKSVVDDINQRFRKIENISAEVFSRVYDLKEAIQQKSGYAVIGTCWRSQYISMLGKNFDRRFSFTQDREGLFRAYDGMSALADSPLMSDYSEVLTAGPWLASRFEKATSFTLGADVEMMSTFPMTESVEQENQIKPVIRIGVYGRFSSPRRAVDLVWLTLIKLTEIERDYEIEVHSFGAYLGKTKFPFKVVDHGVLSQIELNSLLKTFDIGIAYSTTNYSILPIEMLASGVKTFDLYTQENLINYSGLPISLLNPLPAQAAQELHGAIQNLEDLDFDNSELSWTKTFAPALDVVLGDRKPILPKISVCIPTYNGASSIEALCIALKSQNYVSLELNIVDSGSNDETLEILGNYFSDANIKVIDKSEFGHGKTRNLLTSMASAEYVLFLTQDAIPIDPMLLRSMIASMEDEECGLVFSRHIANPDHGPFVQRDLRNHFDHLLNYHNNKLNAESKVDDSIKRFSSDNSALYRRSELLKLPFPDIEYGEDQVWANQFLASGGSKYYLSSHVVMHSHSLDEEGNEQRSFIETDFFMKQFGVNFDAGWTDIQSLNDVDEEYAKLNNIDASILQERLLFNEQVVRGRKKALAAGSK